MKTYRVHYQLRIAPKTFYPKIMLVKAKNNTHARRIAEKTLVENINDTEIEAVLIGEIELICSM